MTRRGPRSTRKARSCHTFATDGREPRPGPRHRSSHAAGRAASVEGMHDPRPRTLFGTPARWLAAALLVTVGCTASGNDLPTPSIPPSASPSAPSPTGSPASPSASDEPLVEGTADAVRLTAPPGGSFLVRGTFPFVPSPCRDPERPSLTGRFPGTLRVRRSADGTLALTVSLPFDRYLEGIAEVPPSWPAAALEAQAIAARSYALATTGWAGAEGEASGPTDLRHHVVPGVPGHPGAARPRPSTMGPRRPAHRRTGPPATEAGPRRPSTSRPRTGGRTRTKTSSGAPPSPTCAPSSSATTAPRRCRTGGSDSPSTTSPRSCARRAAGRQARRSVVRR